MEDKLAAGPIPLGTLCQWFCQVADGLGHAYAHGIRAHRDIKPGNVLIGRDGNARISDFGIAVATNVLVSADLHGDGVLGTPLSMSPEQFVSSAKCDQRSDIYSLGVTLYQAVSGGTFPFSPKFLPKTSEELNRYFSEIRRMHESMQPKPLSSPLWPVIETCLRKAPEDRFANIEHLRSALEVVAHGEGLLVPKRTEATEDFWVFRDQGNTFMRLGKYKEAIKAFDAFLAILRLDDSVIFNRAVCFENLGYYDQALEVYDNFAKRNDVDKLVIGGLVNGSHCLRKLGRKDEALVYARRAVDLDANDGDCWISLGNAAFALERWQDAMDAYSKAHEFDRVSSTPFYNFGLAAESAGNIEAAKRAYSAFLQISLPDDARREHAEKALRSMGKKSGPPQ